MSRFKWRLNFSTSKPSSKLNILWEDFIKLHEKSFNWGSEIESKFLYFLDGLLSNNQDDLLVNYDDIFIKLFDIYENLFQYLLRQIDNNEKDIGDDSTTSNTTNTLCGNICLIHCLEAIEFFLSNNTYKMKILPLLEEKEDIIKNLIKFLNYSTIQNYSINIITILLRILKKIFNYSLNIITLFINNDGIDILFTIFKYRQMKGTIRLLIVQLFISLFGNFRFYIDFHYNNLLLNNHNSTIEDDCSIDSETYTSNINILNSNRNRTHSLSSTGSLPQSNIKTFKFYKEDDSEPSKTRNYISHTSDPNLLSGSTQIGPQGNNTKSFSFAWNVFNEIIKMTPLSQYSWLSNKDIEKNNSETFKTKNFYYEEFHFFSSNLILILEDIDIEEIRINNSPTSNSLPLINHLTIFHNSLSSNILFTAPSINPSEDIISFFPHSFSLNETEDIPKKVKMKGFVQLIYISSEYASTPGDSLSIFTLFSIIMLKNIDAQFLLFNSNSFDFLYLMFYRIEENLNLLTSVRDTSRAIASGENHSDNQTGSNINSSGQAGVGSNCNSPANSLFHSLYGSQFDEYYSSILSILIKLALDEPNITIPTLNHTSSNNAANLFHPNLLIKNFFILNFANKLLMSDLPSLVIIGIRFTYILIKLNPLNIVSLEKLKIIHSLYLILLKLIFFGRLNVDGEIFQEMTESTNTENTQDFYEDGPNTPYYTSSNSFSNYNPNHTTNKKIPNINEASPSHNIPSSYYLKFIDEICAILQLASISLQKRDDTILAFTQSLLLSLWINTQSNVNSFIEYYYLDEDSSNNNIVENQILHTSAFYSENKSKSNATSNFKKAYCRPNSSYYYHTTQNASNISCPLKCMNCESSDGRKLLECLCILCIQEEKHLLCEECDKVFHKSVHKKSHIRIPGIVFSSSLYESINEYQNDYSESDKELFKEDFLNKNIQLDTDQSQSSAHGDSKENGFNESNFFPPKTHKLAPSYFNWKNLISNIRRSYIPILKTIDLWTSSSSFFSQTLFATCIEWRQCMSSRLIDFQILLFEDRRCRGVFSSPIYLESSCIILRCLMKDFSIKSDEVNQKQSNISNQSNNYYRTQNLDSFSIESNYDITNKNSILQYTKQLYLNRLNNLIYKLDSLNNDECSHCSSKKIMIMLTIQLISNFFVGKFFNFDEINFENLSKPPSLSNSKISYGINSPILLLHIISSHNLDALYIYLFLEDNSNYLPITYQEKQFIFWNLREISLLGFITNHSIGPRILSWWPWLLAGTSSFQTPTSNLQPNHYKSSPSYQNFPTNIIMKSVNFSESNFNSLIPIGLPQISSILKYLILQELRTLMSGTLNGLQNSSSFIEVIDLNYIELSSNQINNIIYNPNSININSQTYSPGGSSFPSDDNYFPFSNSDTDFSTSQHSNNTSPAVPNPTLSQNFSPSFTSLSLTFHLKKILIQLNFLYPLLSLLIGERAPTLFLYLLDLYEGSASSTEFDLESNQSFKPNTSRFVNNLNASQGKNLNSPPKCKAIERDLWWQTFTTILELFNGCEDAKILLDQIFDTPTFKKNGNSIPYFSNILMFISLCFQQLNNGESYSLLILNSIVEYCGTNQQLFSSSIFPFHSWNVLDNLNKNDDFTIHDNLRSNQISGKFNSLISFWFQKYIESKENFGQNFSLSSISAIYYTSTLSINSIYSLFHPQLLAFNDGDLVSNQFLVSLSSPFFPLLPAKPQTPHTNSVINPVTSVIPVSSVNRSRTISLSDTSLNDSMPSYINRRSANFSRHGISTASIYSVESENKWENDSQKSTGNAKSTTSFGSQQSLHAIYQAFKSSNNTQSTNLSLSNENFHLKLLNNNNQLSLNASQGSTPVLSHPSYSSTSLYSLNSNSLNFDCKHVASNCVPTISSNFIQQFQKNSNLPLDKLMLLLHHKLIIKAGYENWIINDGDTNSIIFPNVDDFIDDTDNFDEVDDDPESYSHLNSNFNNANNSSFHKKHHEGDYNIRTYSGNSTNLPPQLQKLNAQSINNFSNETYYNMLRTHISIYLNDNVHNPIVSGSFSNIKIRNTICWKVLLSILFLPISTNRTNGYHPFLYSILSLLEHANENLYNLTFHGNSILNNIISLFQIPTEILTEDLKENLARLIYRSMSYNLNPICIKNLLNTSKSNFYQNSTEALSLLSNAMSTVRPRYTLNFSNGSPLLENELSFSFCLPKSFIIPSGRNSFRLSSHSETPNKTRINLNQKSSFHETQNGLHIISWVKFPIISPLSTGISPLFSLSIPSKSFSPQIVFFIRYINETIQESYEESSPVLRKKKSSDNSNDNIKFSDNEYDEKKLNKDGKPSSSDKLSDKNLDSSRHDEYCEFKDSATKLRKKIKHQLCISIIPPSPSSYSPNTDCRQNSDESHSCSFDYNQNEDQCWHSVVKSILGFDEEQLSFMDMPSHDFNEYFEENINSSKMQTQLYCSVSSLSQCLASLSIPDYVIDLDSSICGSWHLLSLYLSPTNIRVLLDLSEKSVLRFTPLSYSIPNKATDYEKNVIELQSLFFSLATTPEIINEETSIKPINSKLNNMDNKEYPLISFSLCSLPPQSNIIKGIVELSKSNYYISSVSNTLSNALKFSQGLVKTIQSFEGSLGEVYIYDNMIDIRLIERVIAVGPAYPIGEAISLLKSFSSQSNFTDITSNENMSSKINQEFNLIACLDESVFLPLFSNNPKLPDKSINKNVNIQNLKFFSPKRIGIIINNSIDSINSIEEDKTNSFFHLHYHINHSSVLKTIGGYSLLNNYLTPISSNESIPIDGINQPNLNSNILPPNLLLHEVLKFLNNSIIQVEDFQELIFQNFDKIFLYFMSKYNYLHQKDIFFLLFDLVVDKKWYFLGSKLINMFKFKNISSSSIITSLSSTPPIINLQIKPSTYPLLKNHPYPHILLPLLIESLTLSVGNYIIVQQVLDELRALILDLPVLDELNSLQHFRNSLNYPSWCQSIVYHSGVVFLGIFFISWRIYSFPSLKSLLNQENSNKNISPIIINLFQNYYSSIESNKSISFNKNSSNSALNSLKLQVTCLKLLRIFLYGSDHEPFIIPNQPNNSINNLVVGFSEMSLENFCWLFDFGYSCSHLTEEQTEFLKNYLLKKNCSSSFNFSQSHFTSMHHNPYHYSQNFDSYRSIGESIKSQISETFPIFPLLKHFSPIDDSYFQLSSSLLILTELLRFLLNQPHKSPIVSAFRNIYCNINSGSSSSSTASTHTSTSNSPMPLLFSIIFDLCSSLSVELRALGISLLEFYLTDYNGQVDIKSLQLFEKYNGFTILASYLCQSPNPADDIIFDGLFSILFWSRNESKTSNLENYFSIYYNFEANNTSECTNASQSIYGNGNVPITTANTQNINLESEESSSSGGLLSVFGWGGYRRQSLTESQNYSNSNHSNSNYLQNFLKNNTIIKKDKIPKLIFVPQILEVIFKLFHHITRIEQVQKYVQKIMNCLSVPIFSNKSNSSNQSGNNSISYEPKLSSEEFTQRICETSRKNNESFNEYYFSFGSRSRFMQSSNTTNRNSEMTVGSDTVNDDSEIYDDKLIQILNSFQHACRDIVSKNYELIFSTKDWIILLSDAIISLRKAFTDPVEEHHTDSSLCFSESGSSVGNNSNYQANFNSASRQRRDSNISNFESDDGSFIGDSIADDSLSSSSRELFHSKYGDEGKNSYVDQLTQSIFSLICRLFIYDITQKYTNNRRWYEIFRLSLPETAQIQEEIILDIVFSMESSYFVSLDTDDISYNYLKNVGYLLEQALEKVKMSMNFCMKVLHALYSLNYRSCNGIRSRLKDSIYSQVRKNLVVKCIVDVGQDLHNRASCLVAIRVPLQSYLASSESKIITDSQLVILIFGMFIEAFDEFQSISNEINNNNLINEYLSDPETSHHHISNQIDHCYGTMEMLLTLLQDFVHWSYEARKYISKLVESLNTDNMFNTYRLLLSNYKDLLPKKLLTDLSVSPQNPFYPSSSNFNNIAPQIVSQNESKFTVSSNSQSQIPPTSWWNWGNQSHQQNEILEEDIDTHSNESNISSSHSQNIYSISPSNYINWFISSDQKEFQIEFKQKINRELKGHIRYAEKVREKFAQRLLRHTKNLLDKKVKDKLNLSKVLSDSSQIIKNARDYTSLHATKDIEKFFFKLSSKLNQGEASISSSSFSTSQFAPNASTNLNKTEEFNTSNSSFSFMSFFTTETKDEAPLLDNTSISHQSNTVILNDSNSLLASITTKTIIDNEKSIKIILNDFNLSEEKQQLLISSSDNNTSKSLENLVHNFKSLQKPQIFKKNSSTILKFFNNINLKSSMQFLPNPNVSLLFSNTFGNFQTKLNTNPQVMAVSSSGSNSQNNNNNILNELSQKNIILRSIFSFFNDEQEF